MIKVIRIEHGQKQIEENHQQVEELKQEADKLEQEWLRNDGMERKDIRRRSITVSHHKAVSHLQVKLKRYE